MLCVYSFKQLVGENEMDYHLSSQNKIGNIAFLTFNMNEMQHKKIIFGLREKLENKAHKLSICFRNHVNRIIDTYLLLITKLFQKA